MKPIQILSVVVIFVLGIGTANVPGTEPRNEPLCLRILADIDGSDRLSISGREVLWIHRHWAWPNLVRINDVQWQPRHSPVLGEKPRQSLFTAPVDFSSARMTVHQGRDTAVLETFDDHILIHFADSPNGRSTYDLTITFDRPGDDQKQSHAGLIGMAFVQQEKTNVVFRYANGKVLAPSLLEGPVVPPGEITDGVQINLRGELHLPKELTVRVRHAGGSSTRGYATLSIDGKVIETLGDDRKKVSEHVLELASGEHSVQWQISGGDIGHCLMEFADAATGSPLSLSHTQQHLDELDANSDTQFIDVQSEQSGWPIPRGW